MAPKEVAGVAPTGPLAGLIIEAIPPKARKAVNVWVFGKAAVIAAKTLRGKWENRTRYQITIPGDDDLYEDMREWLLSTTPNSQRRALQVASRRGSYSSSGSTPEVCEPVDGPSTRSMPTPRTLRLLYDGSTTAVFQLDGHTITAAESGPEKGSWSGQGRSHDYDAWYARQHKLLLTCHSPEARDAVLAHLGQLADKRSAEPEPPRLYLASKWGHWERRDYLRPRDASTVVLEAGLRERLFADVDHFLSGEDLYAKLGMPWHRGYLFEGPPGAGKTSIAQAIATTFDLDVYWMPIRDVEDDSSLIRLISEVKSRCVLLLEDIDVLRAAHQRDQTADSAPATEAPQGASLQGLLNALDGMVTPHGLITIMTTNYPDDLDDALLRPGRTDERFHIGKLKGADVGRLIMMLTGELMVMNRNVEALPAEIVNLVKQNLQKPELAVAAIRDWVAARTPVSRYER